MMIRLVALILLFSPVLAVAQTFDGGGDDFFIDLQKVAVDEMFGYEAAPDRVRDADLLYRIAATYQLGVLDGDEHIAPNEKKAVIWYKRSVKAGSAKAMVALAKVYRSKGSVSKSLRLLSQATKVKENPEPYAFFEMGQVYEYGIGRFQNLSHALELYNKAIDMNVVVAVMKVAKWYESGYFVERDLQKAIDLYQKIESIIQNDVFKRKLAAKIASVYGIVAQTQGDSGEKVKWLKKAAEAGNVDSYVRVARAYQEGEGVIIDMDKAIYWYKKATQHAVVYAMEVLGYIYANGLQDVEVDYCEAKSWYLMAAENGSADAAWNIANFYLSGFCVNVDKEQANLWFKKTDTLRQRQMNKIAQEREKARMQRAIEAQNHRYLGR